LQQLRRELKAREQAQPTQDANLVDALQTEIASLKRELAASKAAKLHSIESPAGGKNGKTPSQRTKATRSAAGKRK
jgi:hypothetical protein